MNIAEFSIKKNVITLTLTVIILFVGIDSFNTMSRLEDPEFTIKEAVVMTPYPGATAAEVELEVTNQIEKAAQELGQLWFVESWSYPGKSVVQVKIKDAYDKTSLPQVWDELRRKVNDYQGKLPPGAGPSLVNDDFGDVYGIHFTVSGEGYSYGEIEDYVDYIRRELILIPGIAKVEITGARERQVFVEISQTRLATLGISLQRIFNLLQTQNQVSNAGSIRAGSEAVRINPKLAEAHCKLGLALIRQGKRDQAINHLEEALRLRPNYSEASTILEQVLSK